MRVLNKTILYIMLCVAYVILSTANIYASDSQPNDDYPHDDYHHNIDDVNALFGYVEDDNLSDPLQPLNEALFEINIFLDRALVRPPAKIYDHYAPKPIKKGVKNFFDNWRTPIYGLNYVLRLDNTKTGTQFSRFAINTLAGLGGIFDVASSFNIPSQPTDFGLTMAYWGVPQGDYIVLPVLGLHTYRSSVGAIAETFASPLSLLGYNNIVSSQHLTNAQIAYGVTGAINARAQDYKIIEEVEADSPNFYAGARSYFWQERREKIRVTLDDESDT